MAGWDIVVCFCSFFHLGRVAVRFKSVHRLASAPRTHIKLAAAAASRGRGARLASVRDDLLYFSTAARSSFGSGSTGLCCEDRFD